MAENSVTRQAPTTSTITVNTNIKYQAVDGWDFCETFQRANEIRSLSPTLQSQVLDLLFHPTKGLGMNILRLGIGSSMNSTADHMASILPGPWNMTATAEEFVPEYAWDGNDNSQVWLSQQAKSYGANLFLASAWTAPGFMKTNHNESDGGTLCGTTGATCETGDWRQVYPNYLVQYVKIL